MMKHDTGVMLTIAVSALIGAGSAFAQPTPPMSPTPSKSGAEAASKSGPAASQVAVSTGTAGEPTVADLYTIEKMHLRDPFVKGGAAAASAGGEFETRELNIHNLVLKGLLQDRAGDFALFVDPGSGSNLILKKGILYNQRNQPVPGVSGVIKPKQKTVHLITSE